MRRQTLVEIGVLLPFESSHTPTVVRKGPLEIDDKDWNQNKYIQSIFETKRCGKTGVAL